MGSEFRLKTCSSSSRLSFVRSTDIRLRFGMMNCTSWLSIKYSQGPGDFPFSLQVYQAKLLACRRTCSSDASWEIRQWKYYQKYQGKIREVQPYSSTNAIARLMISSLANVRDWISPSRTPTKATLFVLGRGIGTNLEVENAGWSSTQAVALLVRPPGLHDFGKSSPSSIAENNRHALRYDAIPSMANVVFINHACFGTTCHKACWAIRSCSIGRNTILYWRDVPIRPTPFPWHQYVLICLQNWIKDFFISIATLSLLYIMGSLPYIL